MQAPFHVAELQICNGLTPLHRPSVLMVAFNIVPAAFRCMPSAYSCAYRILSFLGTHFILCPSHAEITKASYDLENYKQIMGVIARRLQDQGEEWRHVYKSLLLLEYMSKHGPQKVGLMPCLIPHALLLCCHLMMLYG